LNTVSTGAQKMQRGQKSYVCIHVFDNVKPVLLVAREGGSWCFVCGGEHADNASEYRVVGMGHLLDSDPALDALLDLAPEWEAERANVHSPWIRSKCAPLDD
jgi:hypothetical protein